MSAGLTCDQVYAQAMLDGALSERDQLRQQVAELVGALSTMMRLPLEQVEGSGTDARDRIIKAADNARAILAKHAGGAK